MTYFRSYGLVEPFSIHSSVIPCSHDDVDMSQESSKRQLSMYLSFLTVVAVHTWNADSSLLDTVRITSSYWLCAVTTGTSNTIVRKMTD